MANPLYEYAATLGPSPGGSQRDLMDQLTIVDAKETPFLAMVPKDSAATNILFEWPVDKELTPGHNAQKDGNDVTHSNTAADSDFDNAQEDYAVISNRVQWFRRQALVGKLAQDVQNQAGVRDQYAYAVTKKLLQIRRDMECRFCADDLTYNSGANTLYNSDVVTGSSSAANRTRAVGSFIDASTSGIDSDFRTPAASIESSATSANLTESAVSDVLQSQYEQTGVIKSQTLLCGPNLKKRFKDFTQTQFGSDATTAVAQASIMRTYSKSLDDRKILSTVDVYEGDFGTLELVPSLWLRYNFSDGLEATGQTQDNQSSWKAYGYVMDWNLWGLRFNQQPQVMPLPDQGGGPRFCVDAIAGLACKNPLAAAAFKLDS